MVNFLILAGVAALLGALLLMYLDGYWTPQAAHKRATLRLIRQADKLRLRAMRAQLRHYERSINPHKGRK
jgi:hypothetical protein